MRRARVESFFAQARARVKLAEINVSVFLGAVSDCCGYFFLSACDPAIVPTHTHTRTLPVTLRGRYNGIHVFFNNFTC